MMKRVLTALVAGSLAVAGVLLLDSPWVFWVALAAPHRLRLRVQRDLPAGAARLPAPAADRRRAAGGARLAAPGVERAAGAAVHAAGSRPARLRGAAAGRADAEERRGQPGLGQLRPALSGVADLGALRAAPVASPAAARVPALGLGQRLDGAPGGVGVGTAQARAAAVAQQDLGGGDRGASRQRRRGLGRALLAGRRAALAAAR